MKKNGLFYKFLVNWCDLRSLRWDGETDTCAVIGALIWGTLKIVVFSALTALVGTLGYFVLSDMDSFLKVLQLGLIVGSGIVGLLGIGAGLWWLAQRDFWLILTGKLCKRIEVK